MNAVQPPTREQIAEVLWKLDMGLPWTTNPQWQAQYLERADTVLALFPQPTPSALFDAAVEYRNALAEKQDNADAWTAHLAGSGHSNEEIEKGRAILDQYSDSIRPRVLAAEDAVLVAVRDVTPPPATPKG